MAEKTVVWFNHWFSTSYHIIELIKRGEGDNIHVIGSNRSPDSVQKLACDEWYCEEPVMSDEDYLSFCLDFCKEHNVRVFVPRRGMNIIHDNAESFSKLGVLLFLDTLSPAFGIFRSKTETYRLLSDIVPECIPMYFEVCSLDGFTDAYRKITEKYERACFKFVSDEGATSFRVIDNTMSDVGGLYKAPGMKISFAAAEKILCGYDFKNHLIVMPYLKGTEVSCDCLCTERGNIVIPRFKSDSRIYTVKYDETLIGLCERIMDRGELSMPCNIQFRYHGDEPYLLEVNTRMSGGVQLSCLSAGVNIPHIAYRKLFGENIEWKLNEKPLKVSYIENPVVI